MHARPALLSALVVLVAALLAHARGVSAGFVYDDHRFIEQNPALTSVRPWDYLTDPGTASAASGDGVRADIYRPLRTLLFALERAVFDGPAGWHVVSLLLHAVNAWLVLRLLRGLLQAEGPAVVGALLFAVHPITVESVAWVSSQGDLLALTLMLATLLVLERPGVGRTLAGVVLAALACLAKESAVVLPALLLLRDRSLAPEAGLTWRTTLLRTGALAAVVLGYLLLRGSVLPGELAQVADPGLAAKARGFLAATTWYAGALVWPSGFSFETDLLAPLWWSEPAVVVGLGIWLTVVAAGVLAWRRGRPASLLFATLGALAALVPVSQVLVPLKTLAAERFLYPVLPCVAAALGAGALALARRFGPAAAWAPALLAVPLVVVSWSRTAGWQDEEALWRAVREDRPWSARAFEGLGFALLKKGEYRGAERAYTSAFEANPFDGKARYAFAGHLENLAKTLDSTNVNIRRNSDILERRAQVLALTMAQFGAALSVWDEVGLEAGRGSRAMREDALLRLANGGVELAAVLEERQRPGGVPALETARYANNRLLALAGVDPAKPAEVAAKAPLHLKKMRWYLAWAALTPQVPPADAAERDRLYRYRADTLEDLGLDANQSNEVVVPQVERQLVALVREAEAAFQHATNRTARAQTFATLYALLKAHVELLRMTNRPQEAQALDVRVEQRRQAEVSARFG